MFSLFSMPQFHPRWEKSALSVGVEGGGGLRGVPLCFGFSIVFQLSKDGKGYDYKAVKRWTRKNLIGYNLVDCDKVVPRATTRSFLPQIPSSRGVPLWVANR